MKTTNSTVTTGANEEEYLDKLSQPRVMSGTALDVFGGSRALSGDPTKVQLLASLHPTQNIDSAGRSWLPGYISYSSAAFTT
eukprot:scaffold2620_cov143-Skeletonema_menzelii.AAC.1